MNADGAQQPRVEGTPSRVPTRVRLPSGKPSWRLYGAVLMLATTVATGYFGVEASTDRDATLDLTVAVILGSITFAILWLTVGARRYPPPS